MSRPIDRNRAEFLMHDSNTQPPTPPPPAPPVSWDACPPQNSKENWTFQRRVELVNVGNNMLQILLHEEGGVHAAVEAWSPEPEDREARDRRLAQRAIQLAAALQEAADRARPRPA
jgi:hypothetical protein